MSKVKNEFRNIALIDGYEYRYLLLGLTKYLKAHYDSRIIVYVQSQSAYQELQTEALRASIDEVKIIPNWKRIATQKNIQQDVQQIYKYAKEQETFLGTTFNKLRMSRRDIGLGYYLGAYNHPRSPISERSSYENIVKAYSSIIDYWKSEFITNDISLLINGLKEEEAVARALGIHFRYLFCTRIQNYFHWTRSLYCDFPEVSLHYNQLKSEHFQSVELKEQFFLDVTHKKRFFKDNKVKRLYMKLYSLIKKRLYKSIRRLDYNSYYFSSVVKYIINEYRHTRAMTYPNVYRLKDLVGQKYIYFPLATEPEMSLHWMSPECTSQISLIHSISKELPADMKLVIKESVYALGKRSDEFYHFIKAVKNTCIVDARESGLDVISNSIAVATVTGTSGLEAAIMGKPVMLFGRHNWYDIVDHVFNAKTDEDIQATLRKIVERDYNHEQAKLDGARLEQAAINASFDLKQFTNVDRKNYDNEVIINMASGLEESILSDISIDNESEIYA